MEETETREEIAVVKEKIWFVDEHDSPISPGSQDRSYEPKKNWQNFRSVYAFVRRSDGALWIPKRAPTKPIFASCLDASVSGCVKYLQTYIGALIEEAWDEIHVQISMELGPNVLETGYFSPFEHPLSSWIKTWEIRQDEAPTFDRNEYSDAFWIQPDALREMLANGTPAKPDLEALVNLLYPPR